MSSTYISLHIHIVFSTLNREPLLTAEWRSRLHDYLGGVVKGLGAFPEGIGGVEDHVHLLVGLKATHCLADIVRELKKSGTRWMRDEMGLDNFRWQEGYAGFSVSASLRGQVKAYIANQEEHHRIKTFREELVEILTKAGVNYDETYLD